jgi:hypothetical protein
MAISSGVLVITPTGAMGLLDKYCMVIPEFDAVVAITSGVRDMQSVMNLVWNKIAACNESGHLPENAVDRKKLEAKLASLQG